MIRGQRDSGAEVYLEHSEIRRSAFVRGLNRRECMLAMDVFNRPPTIGLEDVGKLKEEIEHILLPLLKASFCGVQICLSYINKMLPQELRDGELGISRE